VAGVWGLGRADGHGVLFISHEATGIAHADRVVGLEAGKVAYEGFPGDLFADRAMMARLGLALPDAGVLASELRARGLSVPMTAMDAESVVAALWP